MWIEALGVTLPGAFKEHIEVLHPFFVVDSVASEGDRAHAGRSLLTSNAQLNYSVSENQICIELL